MSIKQDILAVFRDGEKLTAHQIAARLNRKYSTWLKGHLVELVEIGVLKRSKRSGENGRPAWLYTQRSKGGRDLRAEWQHFCETVLPIPYEIWLEETLLEERFGG